MIINLFYSCTTCSYNEEIEQELTPECSIGTECDCTSCGGAGTLYVESISVSKSNYGTKI